MPALTCRLCGKPLVWQPLSYSDYIGQMCDWAERNHVTPLQDRRSPRYLPPLLRDAVTESLKAQAAKAFGRALDNRDRWAYYEEWQRYDAAVSEMPAHRQALERLGEVLELDRLYGL